MSRHKERTGGGEAVGVHASQTVLGGSIVAPHDGQIEIATAGMVDFDFLLVEAIERWKTWTNCVAAADFAAV